MDVIETRIPDVKLIKPKVFGDERGFFMETWNARALQKPASTPPSCRTTTAAL